MRSVPLSIRATTATVALMAGLAGCPSPRDTLDPPVPADAGPAPAGASDGPAAPAGEELPDASPDAASPVPGDPTSCPSGQQSCPGLGCVDVQSPEHCGRSCTACPTILGGTATCDGTTCGSSCPTGTRLCAGACIPVDQPCNGACPSGSKVCGDRCVPGATCCTDGREGCAKCFTCGNGTCNRQADGTGCGANLVCRTGACLECGAFGQACCAGNRCNGGGLTCQGGRCLGECTPGARECENQVPRTCSSTGQWQDGSPCRDQTCIGGTCQGNCAPAQRRCNERNDAVETCQNGQFRASDPCTGTCRNDTCFGNCRGSGAQCAGGRGGRQVCREFVLQREDCTEAPEGGVPSCTGNGQCSFDCPSPHRRCGGGCCFDLTGSWSDGVFGNTICAAHAAGNTVSFDYYRGPNDNDFQGTFSSPTTMESQFGQGRVLSPSLIQWPAGQWTRVSGRCD